MTRFAVAGSPGACNTCRFARDQECRKARSVSGSWSKRVITRYPPLVTITHVMAVGWLASLPLLAVDRGWGAFPALSAAGWGSLLFLGVGCSGIAYAFWYDALAELDASALSAFQYFQPIVTLVVANRVLGEPVTPAVAAGGTAILTGVWLVNRRRRP